MRHPSNEALALALESLAEELRANPSTVVAVDVQLTIEARDGEAGVARHVETTERSVSELFSTKPPPRLVN